MAKVIFFNIHALGHINPTLPVVAELVRRGEQVVYYAVEDFKSNVERTGAIFRGYRATYRAVDRRYDNNVFRRGLWMLEVSQALLPHVLPQLELDRPDYIVYDATSIWGKYIAQILDVPAICSVTTFAFNYRLVWSQNIPELIGMWTQAKDKRAKAKAIAMQLQLAYGIDVSLRDTFDNDAVLKLVYTSEYLQPFANTFDHSYKFVGPSIAERIAETAFPFHLVENEKVIYISLGTLYNDRPDFYRLCLEALADIDYTVVLSIGRKVDVGAMGTIPSNFIIRDFVPQLEVLKHAALFITHGGMNSASEALYFKVPLVVIPQGADQSWVAQRVMELGAGKTLREDDLTASRLRTTVEEVLTTASFRKSAAEIADSLRAAGGYMRAVDEIELFKQT